MAPDRGSRNITAHYVLTIWRVSTERQNRLMPPSVAKGVHPRLTLRGYYNSFTDR